MPPEEIHRLINAAAPVVVPGTLLCTLAYQLWHRLPWKPRLRTVALTFLVVGLSAGLIEPIKTTPMAVLVGAWAVVGLPAYLVRQYVLLADVRAADADRLRQARGHERRRAPPPVQGQAGP